MIKTLVLWLILLSGFLIPYGNIATAQGPFFEEQIYATVGGTPLWLDFLPEFGNDPEPEPLIIFVHGGAWMNGNRQSVPGPILNLRAQGYSIATLDYRLTTQAGQFGSEPVIWPAQRDDAKAAIRWLRAHAADLNVDPNAFVIWGTSAGGHIAASVALTNDAPGTTGLIGDWTDVSSAVQLGVNYYGPSDILRLDQDVTTPPGSTLNHEAAGSPESLLLGFAQTGLSMGEILAHENDDSAPWFDLVSLAHDASPLFAVTPPHAAPIFIAHGTLDTVIAFQQGEKLHTELVSLGLSSTWHPVPGAGHGMPPSVFEETGAWIMEQWSDAEFIRGDANMDIQKDIADVVSILNTLFPRTGSGTEPSCSNSQDVNDDDTLDISDPVFLLTWLFGGAQQIPQPTQSCGSDPTSGFLDCETYNACP